MKYASDLERVTRNITVDAAGCWVWSRAISPNGYGQAYAAGGRAELAHRLSYRLHVGPISDELQLDHLCRNRKCVNPQHLEPVTCQENLLRSPITLASVNAKKTHCNRGHEFTPANTRLREARGSVWRICRACDRYWNSKRTAA